MSLRHCVPARLHNFWRLPTYFGRQKFIIGAGVVNLAGPRINERLFKGIGTLLQANIR